MGKTKKKKKTFRTEDCADSSVEKRLLRERVRRNRKTRVKTSWIL